MKVHVTLKNFRDKNVIIRGNEIRLSVSTSLVKRKFIQSLVQDFFKCNFLKIFYTDTMLKFFIIIICALM